MSSSLSMEISTWSKNFKYIFYWKKSIKKVLTKKDIENWKEKLSLHLSKWSKIFLLQWVRCITGHLLFTPALTQKVKYIDLSHLSPGGFLQIFWPENRLSWSQFCLSFNFFENFHFSGTYPKWSSVPWYPTPTVIYWNLNFKIWFSEQLKPVPIYYFIIYFYIFHIVQYSSRIIIFNILIFSRQ